jgi:hypothetical protein
MRTLTLAQAFLAFLANSNDFETWTVLARVHESSLFHHVQTTVTIGKSLASISKKMKRRLCIYTKEKILYDETNRQSLDIAPDQRKPFRAE